MAPLLVILAAIGLAIKMFSGTGFAQRLSTLMIGLSGDSLLLLLVLAMIVSLVFGLGMPAPAAYILTASLGATAMIQMGIRDLTAHMFVFYFAMYASLTPPVGPSTVIAANIAEADFVETSKRSMQLAIPGFVVPYAFVINGELIYWAWPSTLVAFLVATVSVVGLCLALSGHDGRSSVTGLRRAAYFGLALAGLFGSEFGLSSALGQYTVQIAATLLLAGLMLVHYQGSRSGVLFRSQTDVKDD